MNHLRNERWKNKAGALFESAGLAGFMFMLPLFLTSLGSLIFYCLSVNSREMEILARCRTVLLHETLVFLAAAAACIMLFLMGRVLGKKSGLPVNQAVKKRIKNVYLFWSLAGILISAYRGETLPYRVLENTWKSTFKSYYSVYPAALVDKYVEQLDPNGYDNYCAYEGAVGLPYYSLKITDFRNLIRYRKEFLKRWIKETERKIAFTDQNIRKLPLADRLYYIHLRRKIKSGNNGLMAQELLDAVLALNFGCFKRHITTHDELDYF